MADAFPTAIPPDRITNLGYEFNTTIVKFENGAEQRFRSQTTPKTTYRLQWKLMPNADLENLIDHFNDRCGAFRSFTWADGRLDGTKTVRFKKDELKVDRINANYANVSVEVLEC